jgi:GntR family transcriptional regulator
VAFSNRPLYMQVRDVLAERIASGGLLPGSAFPSEGDLAREIGVSAGTVRKALQIMESDRLVVRQPGRGTFVTDPSSDALTARFIRLYGPNGSRISGQILSTAMERAPASDLERRKLRLASGAEVCRAHRVRQHDGTPFLVEDIVLPADLFPGLGDTRQLADHLSALARKYGILLGNAEERVSAVGAPAAVAEALGIAPGTPVVLMDRLISTLDQGRPVEWRLAHCHLPGGYYLAELR